MTNTKQLCGILTAVFLIFLTSCDKKSVESGIVGTWTAVSQQRYAQGELWMEMNFEKQEQTFYYDGKPVETEEMPYELTFTLTDDGKYTLLLTIHDEEGSDTESDYGTYQLIEKGDDIYLSYTGTDNETMEKWIMVLSDHLLKLQYTDEDASLDGENLNYTMIETYKR